MTSLVEQVHDVLTNCLYQQSELAADGGAPADAIIVEGLVSKYGFHPQRLFSYKERIADFCNQLPDDFQKSKGGGWSFLNLCQTKSGEQWGEHRDCENLVALAIGSGQGGYVLPRKMWAVLPGSMPYVWFDTQS